MGNNPTIRHVRLVTRIYIKFGEDPKTLLW